MIINSLKKLTNGKYKIEIDNKEYLFDEDVILKYRLFENCDISNEDLNAAIIENDIMVYYHKTLDYALKYSKNEKQIIDYLTNKGLDSNSINIIISKLKTIGIINDVKLIKEYIISYVRKQYGRILIKEKLYLKGFDKKLIDIEINNIDDEEYYIALEHLYDKSKKKYDNPYKLKKYLFSRGYTLFEIERVSKEI